MSRKVSVFVFLSVIMVAVGCNRKQNCVDTFVGPSCVNGPVDRNNPLPGPGEGVRASMESWGVYEGDCLDNPAMCLRKLEPTDDPALQVQGRDKTFILAKNHQQRYTLNLCVAHPEVPGRHISMRLQAVTYSGGTQGPPFDESDPSKRSPACMGLVFGMLTSEGWKFNDAPGEVGFREDNQDLFSPTEWKVTLGFRVQP